MIGFVFSPKLKGRENLEDIIIPPKLPKATGGSWWLEAAQDGFTTLAERIFREKHPVSTDAQFQETKKYTAWDQQ